MSTRRMKRVVPIDDEKRSGGFVAAAAAVEVLPADGAAVVPTVWLRRDRNVEEVH